MTTSELVKEYLSNEGFPHEIDGDGDIRFRFMGGNLFFTVDDKDQNFFRIIMPNIYDVPAEERAKVLEACNTVSNEYKVLKAFINRDSLWLAIEMFIGSAPDFSEYFIRCCEILYDARRRIAQEIFN